MGWRLGTNYIYVDVYTSYFSQLYIEFFSNIVKENLYFAIISEQIPQAICRDTKKP